MNTIGSSRFNFSLPEAEAKDDMKIAGNQLVGSGQTNDVKTPTPLVRALVNLRASRKAKGGSKAQFLHQPSNSLAI